MKNVRKNIQVNEYARLQREFMEDFDIGSILIDVKKY